MTRPETDSLDPLGSTAPPQAAAPSASRLLSPAQGGAAPRWRRGALALAPLALGLAVLWPGGGAEAQERGRHDDDPPRWARLVIEALKEDVATKPRYEFHAGATPRVFDTQTGRSYLIQDERWVRIEDPLAKQVIRERLDTLDHSVGGIIRAR